MAAPTLHLTNARGGPTGTSEGPLHLTIMGPGVCANVPPPEGGVSPVGGGGGPDARTAKESPPRQHARLHVDSGAQLFIEDLGTKNGTFLRDRRITAGKRTPFQL